jgi:hypothetical protein
MPAQGMKLSAAVLLTVFVLSFGALAEDMGPGPVEPAAAGTGPAFNVSVGGAYLATSIQGSPTVDFYGVNATGGVDLTRRWGGMLDTTYARTADIYGTGRDGYVLTAMAGPVFYPVERRSMRVFVRALGGAGLVDSVVPVSCSYYLHGCVARYAYAAGG